MPLNCALEKVNELLVVSSLRTRACRNSLGTVGLLGGGDSTRGGHSRGCNTESWADITNCDSLNVG